MKNLLYILLLLISQIGYSQTLLTPSSMEVPMNVSGVSISGFLLDGYDSNTNYKVSLSVSGDANGTFSINTTNGLVRDYGFNSWNNITSVNFSGKPTDIQNGLNSISLNTTSTEDGLINLSLVLTSQSTNAFYNPENGHVYQAVSGRVTYDTAKSQANQSSHEGEPGYLVTITSQEEQDFIFNKVLASNIWIALSDEVEEGTWVVDDGPEEGRVIWKASNLPSPNYTRSYSPNGNSQNGFYTRWEPGTEPNNSYLSYGEDHAVTKWNSRNYWNDLYKGNYSQIGGYVIEYGTWTDPTQSSFNSTQQTQITFTQKNIPWINFDVDFGSSIDISDFKLRLKRDRGNGTFGFISNQLSLGTDGKINMTPYLYTTLNTNTNLFKATTTGGNVEWCVIYEYDSNNKRYRVGIDSREFTNQQPTWNSVVELQLFDLYDGVVEPKSGNNSSSVHWNEYWIYTENQIDFNNSDYSEYIRSLSYGTRALKADFEFENVKEYFTHKVDFMVSDGVNFENLYDDIITVSDVYIAFKELFDSGINMNESNEFVYGIQFLNADVNNDGNFNDLDTYKLLQHLQGTSPIVNSYDLTRTMKIFNKSDYTTITKTNWNTFSNNTKFTYLFDIDENSPIHNYNLDVAWVGDVNLSHSSVPNSQTTTVSKSSKSQNMMMKSELVETFVVSKLVDDTLEVTLKLNPKENKLKGVQYNVYFDTTKLDFQKVETNSTAQNFGTSNGKRVSVGSIVTSGNTILDNTTEYKIIFKTKEELKNILGLIYVKPVDAVNENGDQLVVKII